MKPKIKLKVNGDYHTKAIVLSAEPSTRKGTNEDTHFIIIYNDDSTPKGVGSQTLKIFAKNLAKVAPILFQKYKGITYD